jgi:hypothetical protein
VNTGADRAFHPSARFSLRHGEGVSPLRAERTLSSILYNHDSVPDLVTLTCELSTSLGRALTYAEAAAIVAADGVAFDPYGWLVDGGGEDDERGSGR